MNDIRELGNVDIYLLDQLLKGNIAQNARILDAGCGSGRNFSYFANNGFDITGFDPNEEHIIALQKHYPSHQSKLHVSSIEEFSINSNYDFIICSAVLHFARSIKHFEEQLLKLSTLLDTDGLLFIRMTTTHGLNSHRFPTSGVFSLDDNTTRFLISRDDFIQLSQKYGLELDLPFKSVLVEEVRSMGVMVLRKAV